MRSSLVLALNVSLSLLVFVFLTGCGSTRPAVARSGERSFMILSINDVYRINGIYEGKEGGLARVRTLRAQLQREYPDLIFLHAGDFLFPSLLSGTYNGEHMISVMNVLDGKEGAFDDRFLVTFGNHEFEKARMKDTALLEKLIDESEFLWLGSNIDFVKNASCADVVTSANIIRHIVITSNGIKVGLFSLTTDVRHPAYVSTFRDPIETARQVTSLLRKRGAEVVVALTHLSVSEDKQVLETLGSDGPDVILGGHEHDQQSHEVNGRFVLKANADATSAAVVKVTLRGTATPQITYDFEVLDSAVEPDQTVQQKVNWWQAQYDQDYCKDNILPEGCTNEKYAFAAVDLIAEEIQIRKYETNLGNWVADQALQSLADEGAQIAFLNSGSIRLNQNILKGDEILRRHVNEMFPYQNNLKLLQITGADLQKVVDHAVSGWTGNGWWLQIAGFAFTHDPENESATNLTLLTSDGPKPIRPADKLLAVTNDYLLDPGGDQDGYTMLRPDMVVTTAGSPVLTEVIVKSLKKSLNTGISPKVDGRICNTMQRGTCLAVGEGGK